MIFDGVVSASGQHLGHFRPLVAVGSVRQKEDPFFMGHPLHFEDAGIEVVVPALSALLPQSSLHEFSDEGPALRPILLH